MSTESKPILPPHVGLIRITLEPEKYLTYQREDGVETYYTMLRVSVKVNGDQLFGATQIFKDQDDYTSRFDQYMSRLCEEMKKTIKLEWEKENERLRRLDTGDDPDNQGQSEGIPPIDRA